MEEQSESKVPTVVDPEWNDYAMGHFQDYELIDGNPTVAGLRRVTEKLIGTIVSSRPRQIIPVSGNGLGRATVMYEVEIVKHDSQQTLVFADVADVWSGNTDDLFCVHAVATASTRAEGRALRKALKIRAVAAEELCKKDVSKYIAENENLDPANEKIVRDQVNYINSKCKKLDIDVIKFINSGDKQYRSIYEVKKDTAVKMIKRLQEFVKNAELIDDSIKGYDSTWSNE